MSEYTSQQKKRWLQRYRELTRDIERIDRRITSCLQEIDAIRATAEKSTTILSGMPMGGGFTGPEDVWVKLIDLSNEVNQLVDKYVDERRELEVNREVIMQAIRQLNDPILENLMILRYVEGKIFEQISCDIGYCIMQVWRLHGKALERLEVRE